VSLRGLGWIARQLQPLHPLPGAEIQNLCADLESSVVGAAVVLPSHVKAPRLADCAIPRRRRPRWAGPLVLSEASPVFAPLIERRFLRRPCGREIRNAADSGHLALQFAAAWGCQSTAITNQRSRRQKEAAQLRWPMP